MAEALTAETILGTTEDVLRRFGPAKATVVDVARALGVSHGSVYRHFPTKAALREAVTQRWLDRAHAGLAELVTAPTDPPQRLRDWLAALFEAKRRKALGDPELFATFQVLVAENSRVVAAHVAAMVDDLTEIVRSGVDSGHFTTADPRRAARAVFHATARYHDPAHASDWSGPDVDDEFDAVVSLLVAGLRTGV
ncbi:TetR family transcriptional regulator [Saccharothrix longispora]|uniref:AcrR family transcriptional regulator n=1 Tax=Saccharothrix longispora TaxID=33920 RepID=A0ABU1PZE2_9PSEU|nr:TetR family transcriptional regulator [Saccharothrix longispora]MDR6596014.1 AcrR family transcriptional regulator [Saccharothrix longispora]